MECTNLGHPVLFSFFAGLPKEQATEITADAQAAAGGRKEGLILSIKEK